MTVKSPSIATCAIVVSVIVTLELGEWWHWVAVIAAILTLHVPRQR
jgi:hypothetical protein